MSFFTVDLDFNASLEIEADTQAEAVSIMMEKARANYGNEVADFSSISAWKHEQKGDRSMTTTDDLTAPIMNGDER